jgi:Fe2+ or Zn2+ uptake regulation protein
MPLADAGEVVRRLRLAGHQVTAARAAVIRAVAAQQQPFTATQLCRTVEAQAPGVGRATVFRTLELLESEHVLDHLQTQGRYVVRDARERDTAPWYLLCTSCDGVTDVQDEELGAAILSTARRHAFTPHASRIEIVGRCRSC